jgi:hypothetical protein
MRLSHELGRALLDAGSMTWQITWSLILGFTLSAVVQAVVRREAVARHSEVPPAVHSESLRRG